MKPIRYLVYFVSIIQGCNSTGHNEIETAVWTAYLEKTFGLEIPGETHHYIVINGFGCPSCIKSTLAELNRLISRDNMKKFSFVITESQLQHKYSLHTITPLVDKSNALNYLDLDIANVTIITTSEHAVDTVWPVSQEQIALIEKHIAIP